MAMSKKKLLTWALIGGAVGYFFLRRKAKPMVVIQTTVPVLPTDTMMPGSVGPAVEGVIKNGHELSYIR